MVYAPAAPKTPRSATAMADQRCAVVGSGTTKSSLGDIVDVPFTLEGMMADAEFSGFMKLNGLAINTTPSKETKDAICSVLVNGSPRSK